MAISQAWRATSELAQAAITVTCMDMFVSADVREQTSLRQWISSSIPGRANEGADQGPVPGLRSAFKAAGLSCYVWLAESWCYQNGAAFLTELLENEGELCSALGFDPQLQTRLHRALLSHLDDGDKGLRDVDSLLLAMHKSSIKQQGISQKPMKPILMRPTEQQAFKGNVCIAVAQAEENTHPVSDQYSKTEFRRWECDATMPGSAAEGPVPGLRDALTLAGLASYCFAAETWCFQNGAAFVSELIENLDSLCASLGPSGSAGLAPDLCERLRIALTAYNGKDSIIDATHHVRNAHGQKAPRSAKLAPNNLAANFEATAESREASRTLKISIGSSAVAMPVSPARIASASPKAIAAVTAPLTNKISKASRFKGNCVSSGRSGCFQRVRRWTRVRRELQRHCESVG